MMQNYVFFLQHRDKPSFSAPRVRVPLRPYLRTRASTFSGGRECR